MTRTTDGDFRVQVTMLWEDSALAVRAIAGGQSLWVGDGTRPDRPCDMVVPVEILGCDCLQLIAGGAEPVVNLPPGSRAVLERNGARSSPASGAPEQAQQLHLHPGDKLELRVGRLVFAIEAFAHDGTFLSSLRSGRSWKHALYGAGAAAVHVSVLAASAMSTPPLGAHDDETVTRDQLVIMQQYLSASAEREEEQSEPAATPGCAGCKGGGTGTRARGETGAMGDRVTGPRSAYGVHGGSTGSDPHVARSAALSDAEAFGLIGLLNSGAGGDPMAPVFGGVVPDGTGQGQGFGSGNGRMHGPEAIGLGSIGTIGRGAGVGLAHRPAESGPPVTRQEIPIDPNGRFATTYRPGRGHLAAFESAVARGVLPAAARELVSDVGAAYAPEIPPPQDRALAYEARTERLQLPPSGGPTHLRFALRSSARLPSGRPHLSVHLVLDVSGSMSGESLERSKEAAHRLVDKLAPGDDFSLVTFSDSATVRIPDGRVGPGRPVAHSTISQLQTEGGTNIEAALRTAYAQASSAAIPSDAVRVVLLLSDGQANVGITRRPALAALALEAFQGGIQTSTFGLGSSYDGELMSAVAADGAGAYYYLPSGDQIGAALATEVDKRLDPAATAVEIRIRLREDVQLLRVFGSRRLGEEESARVRTAEVAADGQAEKNFAIRRDRQDDREGGMRFFIPAFARDDSYALLVKVAVPPGVGERDAALVELRYKDRVSLRNVYEEIPVRFAYANGDEQSARTTDASVLRTVQGFQAGETLLEAAAAIATGDRQGAALLLEERERILRQAASTLREPAFLADAVRIARLRGQVQDRSALAEPKALALLLETAAHSRLQ